MRVMPEADVRTSRRVARSDHTAYYEKHPNDHQSTKRRRQRDALLLLATALVLPPSQLQEFSLASGQLRAGNHRDAASLASEQLAFTCNRSGVRVR